MSFDDFAESLGFEPYRYQSRLVDFYEKESKVIVCKFRGGGFTTVNGLYAMWKAIQGEQVLWHAPNHKTWMHNHKMLRGWASYLPETKSIDNKRIDIGSGSIVGEEDAIGKSPDIIIVDEAALCSPVHLPDHTKKVLLCSSLGDKYTWFNDILLNREDFSEFHVHYSERYSPEFAEEFKKNKGCPLDAKVESPWRLEIGDMTIGAYLRDENDIISRKVVAVSRYAVKIPEGWHDVTLVNRSGFAKREIFGKVSCCGRLITIEPIAITVSYPNK